MALEMHVYLQYRNKTTKHFWLLSHPVMIILSVLYVRVGIWAPPHLHTRFVNDVSVLTGNKMTLKPAPRPNDEKRLEDILPLSLSICLHVAVSDGKCASI